MAEKQQDVKKKDQERHIISWEKGKGTHRKRKGDTPAEASELLQIQECPLILLKLMLLQRQE